MEQGAKRIWQMDALRGLALLNMLVYHGMYDWVYVFGHPSRWYDIGSAGCHVWQQYICWSFILLSGASFCLGRRQLKNGLLTAGCALILTAVTALVMPSELILFGVLHFNACAVLLTLTGGRIEGAEAVRKSYPDFFRDLFSLCGESISDAKGDDHEA